jgi:hypothetical protein
MTDDVMDEALVELRSTGPEFGSGLSNHGPMAAEALTRIGRRDAVLSWVSIYRRQLQDHPTPQMPINVDDWRTALGDMRRVGDWIEFFERELAEHAWQKVIGHWVPRLVPGLMAGATHGLIRTAHAARSLSAVESQWRLHELAEGLGYWAARFQALPGTPSGIDAAKIPADALLEVPLLKGPRTGLIFDEAKRLDDEPQFAPVIDLVSVPTDCHAFLSAVTLLFAAAALANPHAPIAFIHSITAPSALRMLLPYLGEAEAQLAARYAWQASTALYACYANEPLSPENGDVRSPSLPAADLIEQAVATQDEHAIKFTEACLRESSINSQPVYLEAATAWVRQLRAARR